MINLINYFRDLRIYISLCKYYSELPILDKDGQADPSCKHAINLKEKFKKDHKI